MTERELDYNLDIRKTELKLNKPQLLFALLLNQISRAVLIWGRGTGKSFIIAWLIHVIVRTMPGATWAIQGASYKQILTVTLKGTLAALELLGYRRGVHYVLKKAPPSNWILPFEAPVDFEHYITFYHPTRCVGFQLYSQDREGSSRGSNVDGIITDEGLLLNEETFNKEAKKTNRGNREEFGHLPYHHGIFHFSSMPYGNSGQWLLDGGSYYADENYNFRRISDQLVELQLLFLEEKSMRHKLKVWESVLAKQKELRFYRGPKGQFYSEANAFDNIAQLGLAYLQDDYDTSTDKQLFAVESLNKKVLQIEGSFYPLFDKNIHGYKGKYDYSRIDKLEDLEAIDREGSRIDADCVSNHPLELGLDFGKINWVIVAQHFQSIKRLNYIRNIYVKTPMIIDDLAKEFCKVYNGHGRKVAHVWPDGMGNDTMANAKQSYTEQFCGILRDNGWTVVVKQKSKKNPEHHLKYLLWSRALGNMVSGNLNHPYPEVKFNVINCKELVFAMEQTPALDHGNGLIEKDKSSEKKLKMAKREQATDSTDAADQILFGLYKDLVRGHHFRSSVIIPQ